MMDPFRHIFYLFFYVFYLSSSEPWISSSFNIMRIFLFLRIFHLENSISD